MKRTLSVVLAVMLLAGCLCMAGCGGSSSGAADTFSMIVIDNESTMYYLDYHDNPVISYIQKCKTFENSEGEQATIDFEFVTLPSGKEADNLNTLISTDSYPDLLDLTYCASSASDLYNAGKILDITPYVEEYMPNYKAYIEAHPEYAKYFTEEVDGEERYLYLMSVSDELNITDLWCGWCYRRDWIVDYGVQPDTLYDPRVDSAPRANPSAGKAFAGYYSLDLDGNPIHETVRTENVDSESWVDDVVFPSGNTDPVYISDWEWMLGIFRKALEAEGITDGYCMNIYYPGYIANGDLATGFGGGNPVWYNDEGECKFGAVTDNFKAYLECMNIWWNNGWIDQRFAERSSDIFYAVDDTTVRQGKVGLWLGGSSQLGDRMYNAMQSYTEGIMVYGAAQPINDIYGGEEQQLKEPDSLFQNELIGGGLAVSSKAAEKDLVLLFRFLDYMYSDEGALLRSAGLSEEQLAEMGGSKIYSDYGITAGYTVEEIDGKVTPVYTEVLANNDGNIRGACTGKKLIGRSVTVDCRTSDNLRHSLEQWGLYQNDAFFGGLINSQMDNQMEQDYSKVNSRIQTEYLYVVVPQFIRGEKSLNSDWDAFVSDLQKRNYQSVVDGYNRILGK